MLPLEGAPRIWIDALNDSEERRLWEWIENCPDLVALVMAALELTHRLDADEEPAGRSTA